MSRKRFLSGLGCGLLAGMLLAGCYDPKQVNAFLLKPRAPVSGTEYRVLPPDVISISSRTVPEINRVSQQVRPDGKVNLPLLGEIVVAGRTPKEIEANVMAAASDYYEEADATVTVVGYNSQRFYVFGQVSGPGPKPWTGRDTLLDALAKAQPTTLAWPQRIAVVRAPGPQEGGREIKTGSLKYRATGRRRKDKDNPPKKMLFNLNAMIKSGDLSNNILLKPNDVIYVQANPLAKVGLAIQNLLFPVRPAVEAAATPTRAATAVGGAP